MLLHDEMVKKMYNYKVNGLNMDHNVIYNGTIQFQHLRDVGSCCLSPALFAGFLWVAVPGGGSCRDRGGGLGFWYSHEPLYPQLLSSGAQFCQPACQFCHQGCQLWPECPLPLPQPPLNPEYIAQDNSVTRQRRRSHAVCHGLWQKKVQCKKK